MAQLLFSVVPVLSGGSGRMRHRLIDRPGEIEMIRWITARARIGLVVAAMSGVCSNDRIHADERARH